MTAPGLLGVLLLATSAQAALPSVECALWIEAVEMDGSRTVENFMDKGALQGPAGMELGTPRFGAKLRLHSNDQGQWLVDMLMVALPQVGDIQYGEPANYVGTINVPDQPLADFYEALAFDKSSHFVMQRSLVLQCWKISD
jgi:hypothetical protein